LLRSADDGIIKTSSIESRPADIRMNLPMFVTVSAGSVMRQLRKLLRSSWRLFVAVTKMPVLLNLIVLVGPARCLSILSIAADPSPQKASNVRYGDPTSRRGMTGTGAEQTSMRRFLWDRFPLAAAAADVIPTASMVHLAGIALGRPASGQID
jgi:hypothetical protein